MTDRPWTTDFQFGGGRVKVHKTGADLRLDPGLIRDVGRWAVLYVPVRLKAAVMRTLRPGPRVWFAPDVPRPWYLIWNATAWCGARLAPALDQADVAFYFEDVTCGPAPVVSGMTCINQACTDVSKSHVAAIFAQVFGYDLSIDPETWTGLAVEKGELNGAHDGRTVRCPTPALPGKTYQKLIDNRDGDFVDDLRTPCVDGEPVVVYIKRRPLAERFANTNSRVTLHRPDSLFSPAEVAQIKAFNGAMGLDWGGLDILRDKADGRIYIVDVNKTDMGPPLALGLIDRIRSVRTIAKACLALLKKASR
jgi:hypothetical protein